MKKSERYIVRALPKILKNVGGYSEVKYEVIDITTNQTLAYRFTKLQCQQFISSL